MKKKPIAALILEGEKPEAEAETEEESEEMYDDEGLLVSAEEMMGAVEAKDAEGFASALKAFIEQCS